MRFIHSLERFVVLIAFSSVLCATASAFEPTSAYDVQAIEGWKLYVNRGLLEQEPKLAAEALRVIEFQLYEIVRRVPEKSVECLREIPIWLEWDEPHHLCAAYHPDLSWLVEQRMNPDKARCVEIANAKAFISWTQQQPYMLLHELAHGYHDRFLENGHGNEEIKAAYERARASGAYQNVLSRRFSTGEAYAMSNPMEYFAESTEAFFGTNDFYPFVPAELYAHDPQMFALLKKIWGVSAKP